MGEPNGLICASCQSFDTDDTIKHYSPDMDIKPVPLCRLCLVEIAFGVEMGGGAKKRKERNG